MAIGRERNGNIVLNGNRIIWRNFAGEARQFNDAGKRNFNVVLDDEEYEELFTEGWNVKQREPREEGDPYFNFLKVTVHFGKKTPRIVMISSKGRTNLDAETCGLLDVAEIANVDMIIRPWDWEIKAGNSSKTGRAAYLSSIYVTLYEDELELKYADVQEAQDPRFDEPDEEEFE